MHACMWLGENGDLIEMVGLLIAMLHVSIAVVWAHARERCAAV